MIVTGVTSRVNEITALGGGKETKGLDGEQDVVSTFKYSTTDFPLTNNY